MRLKSPRSFHPRRFGVMLLTALLLVGLLPGSVLAVVTVNSATGGGAISADSAGTPPGDGTYTALTGPTIDVTAGGEISVGTITITAPAGFEFALSPDPTISVGATGATATFTSATTSVLTFDVTGANTVAGTVVIGGIQVRPTVGTPIASAGQLQVGGTAGITDATAGLLTEVPGDAILSFQTAPSTTATAGTALATQPVVLSQDQFGNVRSGDSVLLSSVPSTGGFSCTTNPKATDGSGLASFASEACKFNNQGSFVIRATAAGDSVDSATITVSPSAATKLVFTTQPGFGTPAAQLSPQPVVAIQDDFGNTVTSASATILLTRLTPDLGGPGTLVGCSTAPTVNGVATFAGCRIDTVGVGYRLTATDTTAGGAPHPYTAATSNKFDVRDRLVFTTQPSTTTSAGIVFATQPVVAVRAGTTNTAVNDDATVVTLSIKAGTGTTGAVLSCTGGLSKIVVDGVATFSGCSIDRTSPTSPASPYKILATSTNLTTAESGNVTITAGPATKLGFTAQPNAGVAAQAFPIQPVVAVQDAGGNTVASGTNSTATITLSLAAGGPAGAVLTCTGGLSKVAVAGVATFAGCAVNTAGTHRLVATATTVAVGTTLTSVTGNPFVVTAPTAAITLTTSAPIPPGAQNPVILWGQGFTLTAQFGANGANKQFEMQGTRDLVTWTTITTLTTDVNGRASLFYTPVTNLYYRAVFAGAPDLAAATSNQVRTVVRQLALLRPTNHGATRTINRNSSITFSTTVRPARPELAPARVSFYFYRFSSGAYRLVTKRDVVINSAGVASTTFRFSSSGLWYVRSQANPTPYNANSVMTLEKYRVN